VASIEYLRNFDQAQLFRFFVDGRLQKRYKGWLGYEGREPGSVQAMLNGFACMVDNLQLQHLLSCTYLRNLHRICMLHVKTANPNTSPGDVRHLECGLPFFVKTTSLANIEEVMAMRKNDGTVVFHDKELNRKAEELDAKKVFGLLHKKKKLVYRPWYPNLDAATRDALDGKTSLTEFYEAKHYVQLLIVRKMEEIVGRYNEAIRKCEQKDEKLEVIGLLIRELELLHPFSDGNCRTFANVLLTHLLLYHNFPPAILTNPNLDAEVSLQQWVQEIREGMERTRVLLDDPAASLFDYAIADMPGEKIDSFKKMAAELTAKLDAYYEIFLTPDKVAQYTGGTWINGDMSLRYTGTGVKGTYKAGDICFLTSMEDWLREKKDVRQEIARRVQAGVRSLVMDDRRYALDVAVPVLLVDDVFSALERSAAQVRQAANPKTILITGTEGKTGSKIQMHHLFKQQTAAHAILNSSNARVPVLRSMVDIKEHDRFELLEFSVDADEEKTIHGTRIVNPDVCFFTNVGTEHMHNHKTIEGVIRNKSAVVEGLRENGKVIVNSHIGVFDEFVAALRRRRDDLTLLTYGFRENDTARFLDANFEPDQFGWNVAADIDGLQVEYFVPMVQHHAPLMSIGVLLAVREMGLDVRKAARDYRSLKSFESMGRLHKVQTRGGYFLLYDQSRRSSIAGIRSSFKDLVNFPVRGKVVALLGSVSSVKDNEWTRAYHKELAALINASPVSRLYTTGPNMQYVHENLTDKSVLVAHSDDHNMLCEYLMSEVKAGDLLYIQGYMRLYLENIATKILRSRDENPFDASIYRLNLPAHVILDYKKMLVLADLEKGRTTLAISNRYDVSDSVISGLKKSSLTYRGIRAALLTHFFRRLDEIAGDQYGLQCINSGLVQSGFERFVHNERFCSQWFNNIDKLRQQPAKQIFGSFYTYGDSRYLLLVVVGTVNLHIGFGKYAMRDDGYELAAMDRVDHDTLMQDLAAKMPPGLALQQRSWGHKWVTLDCGRFIDLSRAEVFAAMYAPGNSALFREKFDPLMRMLQLRNQ